MKRACKAHRDLIFHPCTAIAPAINANEPEVPLVEESEPLLPPRTDDTASVNLNHLEETFEGYDLDLARIIVGANPLVAFFTGLLVMGVLLGASFVIHNTDREKHCTPTRTILASKPSSRPNCAPRYRFLAPRSSYGSPCVLLSFTSSRGNLAAVLRFESASDRRDKKGADLRDDLCPHTLWMYIVLFMVFSKYASPLRLLHSVSRGLAPCWLFYPHPQWFNRRQTTIICSSLYSP